MCFNLKIEVFLKYSILIVIGLTFQTSSAQKIWKTLAPQYQWNESYNASIARFPFDDIDQHTPFQNWALGNKWEKPFPDQTSQRFYMPSLLPYLNYNRVQGLEASVVAYYKLNDQTSLKGLVNYGFTDGVFRPQFELRHRTNKQNTFNVQVGNDLIQFNRSPAIVARANTINNLLYDQNFAHLYASDYIAVSHYYQSKKKTALKVKNKLSYNRNWSVQNNSQRYLFGSDFKGSFQSNKISPLGIPLGAFTQIEQLSHELILQLAGNNNQKTYFNHFGFYLNATIPIQDAKIHQTNDQGQGVINESFKSYLQWSFQHKQLIEINPLGPFKSFVQWGGFVKNSSLPYTALKHFNGNETAVMRGSYLEVFALLPYYDLSTDGLYFQSHFEQNFKGNLIDQIPLLNTLKLHSIVSFKSLITKNRSPYHEIGIGFGNIGLKAAKIFRIDFFKSLFNGRVNSGIRVGLVY